MDSKASTDPASHVCLGIRDVLLSKRQTRLNGTAPLISHRQYIERSALKGIKYKILEFNPKVLSGKVKPDSSRPDLLHPVSPETPLPLLTNMIDTSLRQHNGKRIVHGGPYSLIDGTPCSQPVIIICLLCSLILYAFICPCWTLTTTN